MSHFAMSSVPLSILELSISELERRMRPGAYSGGFLGPTESLEAVLTRDRHTLEEAQVTYDQGADALGRVMQSALDQEEDLRNQEHSDFVKRYVPIPDLLRPESIPRFSLDNLPDLETGYLVEGTLQVFVAQRRWRRVNAPHLVALVKAGVEFPLGEAKILQCDPEPEESFMPIPWILAAHGMSIHSI